ncbi:FIST N-terminal domain-containing protein [Succinimonas sp.]|uniref:FIST N-terminal domain-containing protein n=1 Tax=Succinimonas sp. TaxID=1936151 RepID=UPI00386FE26D
MDSITAYTEEIDDLAQAASEIFEQVKDFTLRKNSIGIIFAEEETNYAELYGILRQKWDFPIFGSTAMAMLVGRGFCNLGISFMIITADDCYFSAAVTDDFSINDFREKLGETYRKAAAALPEKPKFILTIGEMVREDTDVDADSILSELNRLSGNLPVYGALASDGFSLGGYRIFCNEEIRQRGQVIVLVAGNTEPRFYHINSINNKAISSFQVTESKGNIVYRLGQDTFVDVLKQQGMSVDKKMVLGDYILSPFVVSVEYPNGDKVEYARTLAYLDHEHGSAGFLGSIPDNAVMSVAIISRADVQASVARGFEQVFEDLRNSNGRYKTILCSTCCARFIALGSDTAAEAQTYKNGLPDDVSLIGIYSYGEYCPIKGSKTGNYYNSFHNFTFSILMI